MKRNKQKKKDNYNKATLDSSHPQTSVSSVFYSYKFIITFLELNVCVRERENVLNSCIFNGVGGPTVADREQTYVHSFTVGIMILVRLLLLFCVFLSFLSSCRNMVQQFSSTAEGDPLPYLYEYPALCQ